MALKSEASEPKAPESEVPPNATALALDIGGTKLAAGIVTGAGELLVSRRAPRLMPQTAKSYLPGSVIWLKMWWKNGEIFSRAKKRATRAKYLQS